MSTILEALRELEGSPATPPPEPPPWRDGSRRVVVVVAIAVVVLACSGVALVVALRSGGPTPQAALQVAPVAGPVARVERKPVARPWSRPQGNVAEPAAERPVAHIISGVGAPKATSPPDPAPRADVLARTAPEPPAETVPRPVPPPEPGVTRIIGAPPVQPRREPSALPRPAGAPHVRVTALSYAATASERVVGLSVDGAIPVRLREGQAAEGIEVQLILPDRVYVRYGANVFAVDARN